MKFNQVGSKENVDLGIAPFAVPRKVPVREGSAARVGRGSLGEPLSITDVAKLLGCSAWTVRQRHIRQGLPYFRSSPNGRLVFFREQVVEWVLAQQQRETAR